MASSRTQNYHVTVACFPPKPQKQYLTCFQTFFLRPDEDPRPGSAQNQRSMFGNEQQTAKCQSQPLTAGPNPYSYLSASIGFIRDAFSAGKIPDATPTT